MQLIHFYMFSLEKCGIIWKNLPFFRADMAGLGKYCMGGYGRIGDRVKSPVFGKSNKVSLSRFN